MILILTINNVEKIIFNDKKIFDVIPSYRYIYETWLMSVRVPFLKNMGQKALYDFIMTINDDDIEKISLYLGKEIKVIRGDLKKVNYFDTTINSFEFDIKEDFNFTDICIYRRGENIKVLSWK